MTPASVCGAAFDQRPIRVGISSCLIGQPVRFDGGHKRNDFLAETLGRLVELVPVCPEFELGLGVPRESIRLVRAEAGEVRMRASVSGNDLTDAMRGYAAQRVRALENVGLSGYVLKRNSPSCGVTRVQVHGKSGRSFRNGRGLFAAALITRYPNLPVEEEWRLSNAGLRENFIERIFTYRRLTDFFAARWTIAGLAAFHFAHWLQLLVHSPQIYAGLSRFIDTSRGRDRAGLRRHYETEFMRAFAKLATSARHVNVLRHAAGYFKDRLDVHSRSELEDAIEGYRAGLMPLAVPVTLVRQYARLFDVADLKGQVYLEPHPIELMLRNHV